MNPGLENGWALTRYPDPLAHYLIMGGELLDGVNPEALGGGD